MVSFFAFMTLNKLSGRAKAVLILIKEALDDQQRVNWVNLKKFLSQSGGIGSLAIGSGIDLKIGENDTADIAVWLEESYAQALALSHFYVGTEHLLLGFLSAIKHPQLGQVREFILGLGDYPKEENGFAKSVDTDLIAEKVTSSGSRPPFCVNLTDKAVLGELPVLFDRVALQDQIISVLLKQVRCHPLLVGPAGSGKTSLIESLAYRMISYRMPRSLLGTSLLRFSWGEFLASGAAQHNPLGAFSSILQVISHQQSTILVLDDLHLVSSLTGSGGRGSSLFLLLLKESLEKGLRLIGSVDNRGVESIMDSGLGLEQYLQPVDVGAWSKDELSVCLEQALPMYEQYHQIKLDKTQLNELLGTFERYLPEGGSLSKILDVVDQAGASLNLARGGLSDSFKKNIRLFEDLSDQCGKALDQRDLDKALFLRQKRDKLGVRLARWQARPARKNAILTKADLLSSLSALSGVPVTQLSQSEAKRYLRLESELSRYIVGQSEAVAFVSQALKKARLRLHCQHRPIGNFLFLGPTGVGKTYLARTVAKTLFGQENFLKLDMSSFGEKHTVSRLIGAPPGYVGYEEGGELVDFAANHPYSVILLDEVDKAHPDVLNILLQVMEDGVLADGQGQNADFSNCILIMTSNYGSELMGKGALGFAGVSDQPMSSVEYGQTKARLMDNLKKVLKPEFLNRLDQAIVFSSLSQTDLYRICSLEAADLSQRFKQHQLTIKVLPTAKHWLVGQGTSAEYGARPLRRMLEEKVVGPLSQMLLEQKVPHGSKVRVGAKDSELIFKISAPVKKVGRPKKIS